MIGKFRPLRRVRGAPHNGLARRVRERAARVVGVLVVPVAARVTSRAVYAAPVLAQPAEPSIDGVISGLRLWLVGILAAVATLFLTVGGLRYIAANGDPGEVEKAKSALRSAALGYGLALLAPLFVQIVAGLVQ